MLSFIYSQQHDSRGYPTKSKVYLYFSGFPFNPAVIVTRAITARKIGTIPLVSMRVVAASNLTCGTSAEKWIRKLLQRKVARRKIIKTFSFVKLNKYLNMKLLFLHFVFNKQILLESHTVTYFLLNFIGNFC